MVTAGAVAFVAACAPGYNGQTFFPPNIHTDYDMDCESTSTGTTEYTTVPQGIRVDAPLTVGEGEIFVVSYRLDAVTTPASGGAFPLSRVGHWQYRFPVGPNASVLSVDMVGGSGYTGTPAAFLSGGNVQFDLLGWQPPETTINYPEILVTMEATGAVGTTVDTTIFGTSYGNWGLKFKTEVTVVGSPVTTTHTCIPVAPEPVFSSTEITEELVP